MGKIKAMNVNKLDEAISPCHDFTLKDYAIDNEVEQEQKLQGKLLASFSVRYRSNIVAMSIILQHERILVLGMVLTIFQAQPVVTISSVGWII